MTMLNFLHMQKLTVMSHPLIQHKLSILRAEDTSVREFRELCKEISMLMAFEAMSELPLKETTVKTPVDVAKAHQLSRQLSLVVILRAGLIMADAILNLVPTARVGHIGMYRDPDTLNPVEYYKKLPSDIAESEVFLLDPMLATGGSANAGIEVLKTSGVDHIRLMCIIAAPEGIKAVHDAHPDVEIIVAAQDSHLNDHGYIVPGLGDAGDRIYGTK